MTTTPHRPGALSAIFQWRSLKTRVTLATLVIFLVGIWSLAFYASRVLQEDMRKMLGEQQFSTVSMMAADINTAMEDRIAALEKVARLITPAVLSNPASTQKFLEERYTLSLMFNNGFYVIRPDGTAIADVPISAGRIGVNYLDRDYVVEALKGKPTIGKPIMGKKTLAPAVVMSAPIRDAKGKVIGVLAGGINLGVPNFLDKIASRYGKTGGYLLISPQHRLNVTGANRSRVMQPIPAPGLNPLLDRYVQGFEGSGITVDSRGLEVLSSAKRIPVAGWIIVARIPTEEAFAPIRAMNRRGLLATILLTLLAGGLTWWILNRQLAPIFATIKALATLSDTDQPPRPLPITKQDEIGELIGGFNRLLETVRQREGALKRSEQEMAVLAEIGRVISSTLDINEVYEQFAAETKKLIPCDRLTVNLYNLQDNSIRVAYISGVEVAGRRQGDPLTMEGSLNEVVMRTRSGFCVQPAGPDEVIARFPRLIPIFQAGLRSIICVPLLYRNEAIGTVHFCSKKPNAYAERDLRLSEKIGTQIAGAMANAQLLNNLTNTEKSLRESEASSTTLIRNSFDVIFTLDSQGVFLFASPAWERHFGYPVSEAIGKDFAAFVHPEDAGPLVEYLMEVLRTGQAGASPEYRVKHADGSWRWVIANGSLYLNPKGQRQFMGIGRDITDRKRADEENRTLQERLNRAEKMEAIGTLAGGVAHDLNNVLGIVVGYSELLQDEIGESNPLRDNVKKIMEGGQRSAAIVQDLLTLARRGVQTRNVVNLNAIIMDCRKTPEFERVLSFNPKVRMKMDLEADILSIMGSPVHLGKTIMNLVSNAVEAMPGGGTLTVTTRNQHLDNPIHGYDAVNEGDYVVLSVTDTGEGISDSDIKHIFEPFYTKKVMGRSGTGLGLAVVWGTVKDQNGYLDVQSEVGKGTTFTLYFPVTREATDKVQTATPLSDYIGHDESILVVDDIKEQRELAAKMLGKLNYRVTAISSGEEAVEYLRTQKADLIVLDMIMDPGMDGLDTYKAILEIHPKQKAIIVSGFSESERVTEARALGAGDYLRKPYVIERLGLAVRKELDRN